MKRTVGPMRAVDGDLASLGLSELVQTGRDRASFGFVALLFAALLALSACGSCQDPGGYVPVDEEEDDPIEEEEWSGLCVEDSDCRLGQICSSGVCQAYVEPGGKTSPCVSDAECSPTERCSTWSGVCVTVAGTQPPPDRPGAVCIDGDRRTCGESKVGLCRLGYQECVEGQWSETCVGVRNPSPETCDGRDNDCDGIIDNAEEAGAWCHDGDPCRLPSRCEDGRCVLGRMKDCGELNDACRSGVCDGATGECVADFFADGTACDDGDLCTAGSTCTDGTCETGDLIDCSALDSDCMVGQCNPVNGRCIAVARMDGTPCDDGNHCTYATVCTAGACGGGAPRDCSALNDQCNAGLCDPATGNCIAHPTRNGQACDDGYYCTIQTVCSSGTCQGGTQRNCSLAGDQCNAGFCDEDANACAPTPLINGTPCENGLYCSVNDVCQEGVCTSGQPRDCGAAGGSCREGICDEATRSCSGEPVADGTPCDDGLFCTVTNQCLGGTCQGSPRDCSSAGDQCNDGVCDEPNRRCTPNPVADGAPCDDQLFCTIATACLGGTCVGQPRDCSAAADQCNLGVCSEALEACVPDPVADGTLCSDGQWCTVTDRCTGGACVGLPRNCSAAGDDCNDGVCNEATESCVAQPVTNGTSCTDGLFCSVDETCIDGTCVGVPRDCSAAGDQCNDGVCNEGTRTCVPQPVANLTPCSDGIFCSVDEKCYDGQCLGVDRDCGFVTGGDPCYDAFCDETNGQCVALDNGTCSNQPPTVSCGVSDTEPWPLETITLTGTASDPDGDPLTFSWAVVSRPNGSTSQPADPTSATTTFFVDLAGQYTFEVTVSDGQETATCTVSIVVVPPQDLHVELVWDEDSGDLDLHVTKHGESPMGAFFDSSTQQRDCWWYTCTSGVGWGASLDIDAVAGFGPENINIDLDPVIGRYHIGVHNYCDVSIMPDGSLSTSKPLNARIRVYCNGQLAAELPVPGGRRALEEHGDFWLAGYVDWTGTGALGCVVTSVDDTSKPAATYLAAIGYQRDQHCRMETPCTAHSQCRPYERCMCLAANCKEIRCVLNPTCTENSYCTGLGYTGGCDTNIGLCVR